MSDILAMGGYGFYVWTSYGLMLAVLLWDAIAPALRRRQALRDVRAQIRRQTAQTDRTA